jgi:hypothetical protein
MVPETCAGVRLSCPACLAEIVAPAPEAADAAAPAAPAPPAEAPPVAPAAKRSPSLEREARSDLAAISGGLWGLFAAGVLGVAGWVFALTDPSGGPHAVAGRIAWSVLAFGCLVVLLAVIVVGMLRKKGLRPTPVALAVRVIAAFGMILLAPLALMVFLVIACMGAA